MNIRIDFPDSNLCEFVRTNDEVDGKLVWPNLTQAKAAAAEIFIDQRNQLAKTIRDIRQTTLADVRDEY